MTDRLKDFERLSPAKQKLLLARLQKKEAKPGDEPVPRSPLRETGEPFPLSFAQQRLWFLDRLEPGLTSYNLADALRLTGRLDVAVLERTLGEIVRRHEALRTKFEIIEGRPVQRIAAPPDSRFPVPVIDLSGLGPGRGEDEAWRLALEEAGTSFDVPHGPHLRARLLRLEAESHVALLTLHHIASDGWSLGVLVRELSALYTAFAAGLPSPLPELPIQYPDFADWQRRWLSGERLEEQLLWWRDALADAPFVLDLPFDRPRPAFPGQRGASRRTMLPPGLTEAVAGLARSAGDTLFMVLLAAFGALLSRLADRDDLVVGSPVANRNRLETEGLIGFFVNTLVLRVDLRGAATFRELLERVRRTTLGAFAHQDLPFERLVEELQPERDLSRNPLFQVSFLLQNAPARDLELPGLTLAPLEIPAGTSLSDLSVETMETPEGLAASWRFDTDLFDAPTVLRWSGWFERLLEAVAADPDRPLAGLPLLSEAERRQVAEEWRAGPEAPPGLLFHELFESWVDRTPDAPALSFGAEVLTYRNLEARANRLAHHLLALGIEPEARVAVRLDRSVDLIVALLAVLKAGGAWLPLDPSWPEERLAFMAADAQAAVTISALAEISASPATRPGLRIDPERIAYVIYTSGSTGRPKGVMVPHGGLASLAAAQGRLFGAGPGSRVLQFASPSFDASVWEILMALGAGAELCLEPREALLPGPDLSRRLAARRITHATLPPPALAVMPDEGLPDLAVLIAAGEACPPPLAARWSRGRRFFNAYGPTEATVCATVQEIVESGLRVPIGRPIEGVSAWVVDRDTGLAPMGVPGELWLGGTGLARGYLGRPDLTAERFVPDRFSGEPGARLYRTGDRARWLPDGALEFLGRIDRQVKVRGVRIEPAEIEAALLEHPDVAQAAVVLRGSRLVAYVVGGGEGLRAWLAARLPEPMLPSAFVLLDTLPVTPGGKLDRDALPAPEAPRAAASTAPRSELEATLAEVWREVLGVERVGIEDNFFDLGGHSLLLVEVQSRLRDRLGREVPLLDLFRHPNVAALARHLAGEEEARPEAAVRRERPVWESRDVAVMGMACRFPGAPDVEAFWHNLRDGVESISFFTDEELRAAGVDPFVRADPRYVRANGVLEGADLFDAAFFDIGPREAQILDPQQRVFLECSAEALERAGYGAGSPGLAGVRVGVYAGTGMSSYGLRNLLTGTAGVDAFEATLGNDKDFVATRVSYELDLRGPAMTVQTACSTSLVAVHLACKALLDGECEMALAGGVGVQFPQVAGYLYQEGGIASADGHDRAFDAGATGTVGGNGAGVVVLKPLAAALADGDPIHAVIKATALNNDGAGKVGFTAPSEPSQAEVIAEAQELAGVPPETIGYVEAHGSATALGDPIEVAALTRAFRARAGGDLQPGSCLLGSVKTNVGHTGSAAGVAGLIKTVLALEHRQIPPSLYFEAPNPRIDFSAGPFRVATALVAWPEPAPGVPRRAGVSSFGLGGTNAHAVVEEAPGRRDAGAPRARALVSISARTPTALEAATDRLVEHLRRHPEQELADVAYTLHVGRKGYEHRRTVVVASREDAIEALAGRDPRRVLTGFADGSMRPVAFVISGLGEQYPGMARGLWAEEPVFRAELDRCAELLAPALGVDIRGLLFPAGERDASGGIDLRHMLGRSEDSAASPLDRTAVAQPALFAVGYALARLWMSWGVKPAALLGYSLGEYVAACLAGVLSLQDALRLVAERARLVDELPAGAMLAVSLPEEEVRPLLAGLDLSLAATNGPRTAVVAGPLADVAALEKRLEEAGQPARRLRTTHAFHSAMMRPAAEKLADLARRMALHPPRIPYLSNVTGTWITPEQTVDPEYWAEHLVRTVRFSEGIGELWREPGRVLLEIGPGQSLSSLALQHPGAAGAADPVALPTLPSSYERRPDGEVALATLGKLWLAGVRVDWPRLHAHEHRRRVPLPGYPFERKRYWIEPAETVPVQRAASQPAPVSGDLPQGAVLLALGRFEAALLAGVETLAQEAQASVVTIDDPAVLDDPAQVEALLLSLRRLLTPGASAGIARHARPNLRNPYVEPATDLERRIAEVWQGLLGIDRVGAHDSFFDLGGDSLLATQVVNRVREAFGVEITLPALFESPTPAGLAALIQAQRPAEGESEAEQLARLMEQVDSLSEEEIERMLAERGASLE